MKSGMTIEYLKCRADFSIEVDFGVNGIMGTIDNIYINPLLQTTVHIHT